MKRSKFFQFILGVIITLGLSLSFQSLFAWQVPLNAPPLGNTLSPVYNDGTLNSPFVMKPFGVGDDLSVIGDIYVSASDGTNNTITIRNITSDNKSGYLLFQRAGGSTGAEAFLTADRIIGSISFRPWISGSYLDSSKITSVTTEAHSTSGKGSDLRFYTTGNGTLTIKERMRIANDGNVGIGVSNPTSRLTVAGSIKLENNAVNYIDSNDGLQLRINADGGTGQFGLNNSSNARLLTITDEGRVGIGSTSPSQLLSVDGYVQGWDGVCIGGDCRTSWPSSSPVPGYSMVAIGKKGIWLQDGAVVTAKKILDTSPNYEVIAKAWNDNGVLKTQAQILHSSNSSLRCNSGWIIGTSASCKVCYPTATICKTSMATTQEDGVNLKYIACSMDPINCSSEDIFASW